MILLIAGAGTVYFLWHRSPAKVPKPASVRVVRDRPGGARVGAGAKISEPEAILRLRRSLGLPNDCVAVLSHGFSDGAYVLTAVNRCDGTRLGNWRVDGTSGAVVRPEPGKTSK